MSIQRLTSLALSRSLSFSLDLSRNLISQLLLAHIRRHL